jgi:hypothetical protein
MSEAKFHTQIDMKILTQVILKYIPSNEGKQFRLRSGLALGVVSYLFITGLEKCTRQYPQVISSFGPLDVPQIMTDLSQNYEYLQR